MKNLLSYMLNILGGLKISLFLYIKILLFLPFVIRNLFLIFFIIIFSNKNKNLLLIKGDNLRLHMVCPYPRRFIYLRDNYNLMFFPTDHISTTFLMPLISLIEKLSKNNLVKVISDQAENTFWDFSLEWNNLLEKNNKNNRTILTLDSFKKAYEMELVLYFPLLKENVKLNTKCHKPFPLYIGRIDKNLDLNACNNESIIKDDSSLQFSKNID